MKAGTTEAVRVAWLVIALSAGVVACQESTRQEETLADLYPDYLAFSPADLARGQLAIQGDDGGFGASAEIGKLRYSNTALILLGEAHSAPGFTVADLSRQIDREATPLIKPNCYLTSAFRNETFVVDNCLLSRDPDLLASYQEQTGAPAPTKPLLRARLARTLAEDSVYRCRFTASGAVSCQNSCCCGACVTCRFVSDDGSNVSQNVPKPNRSPDSETSLPCNSMNQCP